jgi:tRNA dimethylallyltransferase
MSKHLIVICGPTAIGKSALAIQLARHFHTEIISADSRQVFKHLNIGTAKPDENELKSVKHHLIDIIELDKTYNAGQFAEDTRIILSEIYKKNDYAILCGGTGLYIKALLEGIDPVPVSSSESIQKVNELLHAGGIAALQEKLLEVDPVSYHGMDLQNPRRLSRALEVYFTNGIPLSKHHSNPKLINPFQTHYLFLNLDRKTLYEKIDHRVDHMIELGLKEEVQQNIAFKNYQAMQTVGYKEMIGYLEGQLSLESAIMLIKQHTRNYAKRQITWFKKYCPAKEIQFDLNNFLLNDFIRHIEKPLNEIGKQ